MTILSDYQDRPVRLTEERLTHILLHSEMIGMESAIVETLKNPQLVRQSRSDNAVALIYRFYSQTSIGSKWLCVVVKYLVRDSFVVTAYFTNKPKQGEDLWLSK
jgi:hypothetical protein